MKQLIFLLVFIPALSFGQVAEYPDYEWTLTDQGGGLYTVEKCDMSNVNDTWKQCNKQTDLTLEEAREFLYKEKKRVLNKKGGRDAHSFIDNRALDRVEAVITSASGDYAAWSQNLAASSGALDGIYKFKVVGGSVDLEVTIQGLTVTNNATQTQIGTLTGDLAEQWINITANGTTYHFTAFNTGLFLGTMPSGNVSFLKKIAELPESP